MSVFDLLLEYIDKGKIKLDNSKHPMRATYHDPCNYGRKSEKTFGKAYYEEGRNYCCGAGGGAWAMPFGPERVYYGRVKARQVRETEAHLVIAPCHNCRDQLLKSLNSEYDLGIEVKYLWELVADSLIQPGQETEATEHVSEAQ